MGGGDRHYTSRSKRELRTWTLKHFGLQVLGHGPNTVLESTVFNTELSENVGLHRVPGRPLGLLFVCQSELSEFFAELTEFAKKLSSLLWNSTFKTIFRPCPIAPLSRQETSCGTLRQFSCCETIRAKLLLTPRFAPAKRRSLSD